MSPQPEWPDVVTVNKPTGQSREEFEHWLADSNERIGLQQEGAPFVFTGSPLYPKIFTWRHGCLYKLDEGYGQSFFRIAVGERGEDEGVVMCRCGSETFAIRYGAYECIAICSACGSKGSVYSG